MAVGIERHSTGRGSRSFAAHIRRTIREALRDNVTDEAAALAYYAFLALPATLLLALGIFGLLAGDDAVQTVVDRAATVMPAEAVSLVETGLSRVAANQGGSAALVTVGAVLALWTATSAMTALMRALNRIYGYEETRTFVRQRLVALALVAVSLLAFGLLVGLLVLGPPLSRWIGDAVGLEATVGWVWWAAQWPLLLGALFATFAAVLRLGPSTNVRRRLVTPGAGLAVALWLLSSGLFAVYTSLFGSYDKTWGTLAGVVVTLTWLWLSALALLVGAEVDARPDDTRTSR